MTVGANYRLAKPELQSLFMNSPYTSSVSEEPEKREKEKKKEKRKKAPSVRDQAYGPVYRVASLRLFT